MTFCDLDETSGMRWKENKTKFFLVWEGEGEYFWSLRSSDKLIYVHGPERIIDPESKEEQAGKTKGIL